MYNILIKIRNIFFLIFFKSFFERKVHTRCIKHIFSTRKSNLSAKPLTQFRMQYIDSKYPYLELMLLS